MRYLGSIAGIDGKEKKGLRGARRCAHCFLVNSLRYLEKGIPSESSLSCDQRRYVVC